MKIALFLSIFYISGAWAKWNATSYNIRNFDRDPVAGATNISQLTDIIKDFKSDVMTFVEVVNASAFKRLISDALPGYKYQLTTCGGFGNQKLALVYNPKTFKFISAQEDLSFSGEANSCGSLRSVLITKMKNLQNGETYNFISVHLKAGGDDAAMDQRSAQYAKLTKLMNKYKNQNLVVMGDFNTTGYIHHDRDYNDFTKMLRSTNTKTMSANLGCTSYWEGEEENGRHQSSILDHILVGSQVMKSVGDVYVGTHCAKMDCKEAQPEALGLSYKFVSDHCPIQVNFQ